MPPKSVPSQPSPLGVCMSHSLTRILSDLKESLSVTEQDFTTGSIGRAVTLLAVPMVLELSMQSVFGVVDLFFVARLGSRAVATVGLTEAVLTIVFAIATGLGMGATALVARRIGEKSPGAAALATGQAIIASLAISIPISLAGLLSAGSILELMGASRGVVEVGTGYNLVMLTGSATILLLFVINAVFRGTGDALTAMRVLWAANLLNMVLDPLLIFGLGPFPEWGVTGAAVATTLARAAGVLYQLAILSSPRSRLPLTARCFRLNAALLWKLIRISLGGVLQLLIGTASWLGLVRIIAVFGNAALAGYTIGLRIIVFAILPSWGMSNAAATLVGQNLGAGQPDRAERSVWLTGFANMVFLALLTVTFVVLAEPLARLFTAEAEVIPHAVDCLRFISYGYVFYAYGMVVSQAFNGAGDTYTPTLANFVCYWILQIPLAYFLAFPAEMGVRGVFAAIAISESILAVVIVLLFRRGRWKKTRV